jgi:hypothetical protein
VFGIRRSGSTKSESQGASTEPVVLAPYGPVGGSHRAVWLEHPLPEPLSELGGLDPPARIVECEVLGALTILEPGETTRLVTTLG